MTGRAPGLNQFIIKVASRCNLNCSYCYVYNQADTSWRNRPARMSSETWEATLERIRAHCIANGRERVELIFHGGEPTLIGSTRLASMCGRARERLEDVAQVRLSIQTNATRLNPDWVAILREHDVGVGVSLDGPKEVNDRYRVDHRGRGSHDRVAHGIALLREAGVPFGILSVVAPGEDPLRIHRHFIELGCGSVSYLLPSVTREEAAELRGRFGPTPCADFLIPIFDEWWCNETLEVRIREFWSIGRVIMGGRSLVDSIGNPPLRFVTVETDGSIHGVDNLRTAVDGLTGTSLNVHRAGFGDIAHASPLHDAVMRGLPLPTGCRDCPESETCAGGYVPARYSQERQFDNPSMWCADLLALFTHVRARMGVSYEETRARRQALEGGAAQVPAIAGSSS